VERGSKRGVCTSKFASSAKKPTPFILIAVREANAGKVLFRWVEVPPANIALELQVRLRFGENKCFKLVVVPKQRNEVVL